MLSWLQIVVGRLQLPFTTPLLVIQMNYLIVWTGTDLAAASVDKKLAAYLKKYFPEETKAKQQENDIAASVEMYGEDFANVKCLVM